MENDTNDNSCLSGLLRSICRRVETTSSVIVRLLSRTQWTAMSTAQESWSLYRSAALLVGAITVLRMSKGWCFGNGMYLRRRVLLLAQIRAFVLQWEGLCVAEVEACNADVDGRAASVLTTVMGAAAAARMVASWTAPSVPHRTTTSFYGITASIAFSAEIALEELLDVAYMAHHVLHLPHDRAWLQRFERLLQYILLRRVSLMEEVRFYARLYQRALFPAAHPGSRVQRGNNVRTSLKLFATTSSTQAWRLHRRPTWLVPLASANSLQVPLPAGSLGSYLCLPLSYFPVESVLTYTAAESWLSDRLMNVLLPEWKRSCIGTLRECAAAPVSDRLTEAAAVRVEVRAACKISYWFLHHTAGLLQQQLELHRNAARRFYTEELYALAFPDSQPRVALPRVRDEVYPVRKTQGSLRLLLRAACDCVVEKKNPQRVADTSARKSSIQSGRRVRRALVLRALSQGLSITLQVWLPRLSLRHMTEMIATGYCLKAAAAAESPSSSSSSFPASPVEALLTSLAAQMAWTTAAGVAELLLQSWLGSVGVALSEAIAANISAELQSNLLHVDEAFLRRWLQGASSEHGESPSPSSSPSPSPKLRTGSAGSYLTRRSPSVEDVLSVGRRSGEKVMAVHDAVVKRWLRILLLGLRTAVTREWRPLLGAVATAWVDVPRLTSAVSVYVGYSLPQDVTRLLSRRDESLPTSSPAGLRLLLEVLVEDAEEARASLSRIAAPTPMSRWRSKRSDRLYSSLSHPYLALVACSNVWSFDHLLGESLRKPDTLYSLVQGVRRLHTTVAAHAYGTGESGSVRGTGVTAAMQEDARCIAYYSVHQMEQVLKARHEAVQASGTATTECGTLDTLHPLLDTEETRLLQTPSALAYLPEHVDYFDLFSLPYRFILRQLGLEMVFAYRTATGMQQESRQMAEEWWTLTLFNSTFNPLTSALQEGVQLLASCGTVLLLCTRVDRGAGLVLAPITLAHIVQASHTMDVFREVLRGGVALRRLEGTLCAAQQLCECLPQTIWSATSLLRAAAHDAAPTSKNVVSALQLRRRQWRTHLARSHPELLFDRDNDYVVGGLRLREEVRWHHVFFAYPQLYSLNLPELIHDGSRSVRPTLSDVNFACPATGMTAVIGPSSAGKSSLNLLLRRFYDPLPVVAQEDAATQVPLRDVGLFSEAEQVLVEVLRLALIENALPPPPSPASWATASTDMGAGRVKGLYGLSMQPGYIGLDGLPMCLFSVAYVRQWFAWLPQVPTILSQQSFLCNVRALSPAVTLEDAQAALRVCGCREFVEDRRRTVHDRVGPLSGGEGQRLALARVVAGAYARHRLEVIYGCVADEAGEDGVNGGAVGGLLLDEPTSRLDAVNELRLLAALSGLREDTGKSPPLPSASNAPSLRLFTWIISHRLSSLRAATFMVVVEDGAVTAAGHPRGVLQNNAFAQKQWQLQRLKATSDCDGEIRQEDELDPDCTPDCT